MLMLTPDRPVDRDELSKGLAADVLMIEAELQVTQHLRQVLLTSFHLCDSLGDSPEPSTTTSYRYRVVKSLPFHGVQVLVNMKILKCDARLRLCPKELRDGFFLQYLNLVVKLSSGEPTSQQSVHRYPIPAPDRLIPLAQEIIRARSHHRKSSSARLDQHDGVAESPSTTQPEAEPVQPSATSNAETTSYFVHCEGSTVHVFGLVEIDPRILGNRLQQSHVSAPYMVDETETPPEQTDSFPPATDPVIDPSVVTITDVNDTSQDTREEPESGEAPMENSQTAQSADNPRKRTPTESPESSSSRKQPRLRTLRSANPKQNREKSPDHQSTPGPSVTNQATKSNSPQLATANNWNTEPAMEQITPLTRIDSTADVTEQIGNQPQELEPNQSEDESIPLRNILSNAVTDSRRSVRTWGPTLKIAIALRTNHSQTPEREQARVKVKMELLAAENLFTAVNNRKPTLKESTKIIGDAFTKFSVEQVKNEFQDAELTRAHRELGPATRSANSLSDFYQTWLPKLNSFEEYIKTPVLQIGLFQNGYFQQHYSLATPVSKSILKKPTTVIGQVRGAEALAILKKVLAHLMLEHPGVQLQTEVCNSVALRSLPFTWCTSEPTTSSSIRATSVFSTCNSLTCMTTSGCLLRSSTIVVGLYDDPCLDLLAIGTRILHCTLNGELRVLVEARENSQELRELVQSRLPFLTTVLTGNSYIAPTHPSLAHAGEVPAVTVCGTERIFGHSGTCLNIQFPPEVKDPTSPDYAKYLERYSLLRICLQQFGFTVLDHHATGNMKIELSTITAAVASTFYQYVGLLVRGSPSLTSIPNKAFDDQIKLKTSPMTHKIPTLFSTSGVAPESMTRGYVSRYSRRGIPSALWERFNKVAKAVYMKGPYGQGTPESRVLESTKAHLVRLPNPFCPCLTILERGVKMAELNTVLHVSETERKFFLEQIFTSDLIPQTRQLCQLPFCGSKVCQDNVDGYKRFKEELQEYRESEVSADLNKVPTHWQEVFNADSGRTVHLCDPATRLLDLRHHLPICTGFENLSEGLRSPALVLHMQEGDWTYHDLLRLGAIYMHTVDGVYKRPSKTGRKPGTRYHPLVAAFSFSDLQTHYFVSLKHKIPTRLGRNYLNLLN
ncbi:unnamed protein product [Oikopleura dioica]|uniref:Uncharacterized protein n=1 Tax=Oikopleura dioica TaxID=34765 RepID=E4Y7B4_OIKDI|nr:unnamed protein product [Oikopleura dioica]